MQPFSHNVWFFVVFNIRVENQSVKREKIVDKTQTVTPRNVTGGEVMGTLLTLSIHF